jgi:hypothetical protein
MPCKNHITTKNNSNLFFLYVWVHFGLPTSIISNRDTRLLGDFWKILWRMMDTKLKRSIFCHPQTDGHIEVVNQTVVLFIQGYYSKHPKLRDEHIPYVQHAYNQSLHSSTQCSPFKTRFGNFLKFSLDLMYGRNVDSNEEINEDRA